MSTDQVWRVELESGEARDVIVKMRKPDAWQGSSAAPPFCAHAPGAPYGHALGMGEREAVAGFARMRAWSMRSILAPGEPTRAEAIEAAVLAEREACAQLCEDRAAHLDAEQGEEEPDEANDDEMEGYGRFLEALHLTEAIRGRGEPSHG